MYRNVVYTVLDQLISYIDICPMGILFRIDPQYPLLVRKDFNMGRSFG